MMFTAYGQDNETLVSKKYYSVGGGFFLSEDDVKKFKEEGEENMFKVPLDFSSGKELI